MSDAYIGEIRMFAGRTPPQYWQFCNGQTLDISQYQALYSLIGVTYGGNGSTTFALPDLRGKTPIGQGTGTGLAARTIGQTGGSPTVTLTEAQMPAHTHTATASTDNATTDTPGNTVVFAGSGTNTTLYTKVDPSDPKDTPVVFDQNAVSSTAGSQSHNNVMPSFAINFIICTTGIYPDRP